MDTLVQLENVTKRYDGAPVAAVDGVSLRIDAGEAVAITGLVAGIIAVPAGILLHRGVLPAMAHAANSGLPTSLISVYSAPEMVILALAGLVIAIALRTE